MNKTEHGESRPGPSRPARRDETDLDTLGRDLIGVVGDALQPEHVSMWLRPDTASRSQQTD